jgi:polysaccharide export outer membrane protein
MFSCVKSNLSSLIWIATALLLSGCASSSDFTVPMPDLSSMVPADAASESTQVAAWETVAYGEPSVVPAGFGGGPQAVADADGPYLLDTGDKLRVFVYGQPNLSRGYTVDHEGSITVPLIGTVKARGLTTRDLEASITARLGREFVRDPQVTVDIQQNRPFFIHGEVKTAGQYPYVSGMTVETAVAIAGGLSERGSTRQFRVTRRTNGFVEQIIAPADYVIKPGDTVFVYERFF